MPTLDDARAAAAALRQVMEPTPCQLSDYLSGLYGAEVWLKREDLSPVRSYKLRGAWTAMRQAGTDRFVCASAGNHAQGVAWSAARMGTRATIFMPVTTPRQKIDKTLAFGGEAVTVEAFGDTVDQTLGRAREFAEVTGAHFLSPFDDDHVIEGQASVALEMLQQMPEPDMIVLPVGGGGLSAGTSLVLSALAPSAELHLVEPAGGASLAAALSAGRPVLLDRLDTFVDGAAVGRIGERPFLQLRDHPARLLHTVPEDRLCETILRMLNVEGIVLEPAGALSVDALKDLDLAGRRVCVVTTGGNFDFERLPEIRERAQRFGGLKRYYLLRLPQRPGALRDFLGVLGPDDDIARFEYLKKSARNFGTVLLGIESNAPENLDALEARAGAGGFELRDITGDETVASFVV